MFVAVGIIITQLMDLFAFLTVIWQNLQ